MSCKVFGTVLVKVPLVCLGKCLVMFWSKYLDNGLVSTLVVFWSKCFDGVLVSALVVF